MHTHKRARCEMRISRLVPASGVGVVVVAVVVVRDTKIIRRPAYGERGIGEKGRKVGK